MEQGELGFLTMRYSTTCLQGLREHGKHVRQDTIPKLRHGNHRLRSRNANFSKGSSAVVFNAKWLLQRWVESGGCVMKQETDSNTRQPSGLIFYKMPLSPEEPPTVCLSVRPKVTYVYNGRAN
jgi:hypothetical protein